jgi:hypothetical protein
MAISIWFSVGLVLMDEVTLGAESRSFRYACRSDFSLLSSVRITSSDHRTTARRPRRISGRCPLDLALTTPQAMFVSSATLFSTGRRNGTQSAAGSSDRQPFGSTSWTFGGRSEEHLDHTLADSAIRPILFAAIIHVGGVLVHVSLFALEPSLIISAQIDG